MLAFEVFYIECKKNMFVTKFCNIKHVNIRNFKNSTQIFEASIIQIKEAQELKSVWFFRKYIFRCRWPYPELTFTLTTAASPTITAPLAYLIFIWETPTISQVTAIQGFTISAQSTNFPLVPS